MQPAALSKVEATAHEAPHAPGPAPGLTFRTYTLIPGARLLLDGGRPVPLGGRAFDLLHILLSSRGQVVAKDELIARVWPCTFVEESNLRFQVGALRRALGRDADLIKTVSGRGYLLAEEVAPLPLAGGLTRLLAQSPSSEPVSASEALRALVELLARELAPAQPAT